MAAKRRRPYHPPVLSDWLPPLAGPPGYIMGETGPQGFGTADYFVAQIPCATAREIIRREHYSHSVVNNSYVNLGVFLEGAIVGVLQWGYALNPARAGKIVEGTVQGQYMELNRMWLSDDAPRNSESRAISYSLKYIRRACPSVAWVQSYADERCQGLGVVYQACSFLYLGFHESPFYELDGEVYHKLLLTAHKLTSRRGAYLAENIDRAKQISLRQYRYIRFLKTDWIKRPAHADTSIPQTTIGITKKRRDFSRLAFAFLLPILAQIAANSAANLLLEGSPIYLCGNPI